MAMLVMLLLAACATLPDADEPTAATATAAVHPVVFSTANGPVSSGTNRAILRELKQESGSQDILQKHLAVEQAVSRNSPMVLGNKLTLLLDGPNTYDAMFKAIREANDHINLETYIFEDSEIGQKFAALLLEKQAAGVQVNLIYDSVGCLNTPAEFFERLRAGGIQLLEFNPVNPTKVKKEEWLLNNRDHRKLLVVDGRIAFLGGINISEAYSRGSFSHSSKRKRPHPDAGWRDTQLQIEGPVVAELQRYFMATWAEQKGTPLAKRNYFPKLTQQGGEIVRAIASVPDMPDNPIYLTLLSAIGHAEQTIHLTNAYFVPDPQLIEALTGAARRGVEVTLVLPGKSDSWAVFHAGRSHYAELLEAGVRLYERRDTVLHAKTATIDGVWSTVGSTNLDWRSFLHNDELNAIVLGADFARQMDAMFDKDVEASTAIDPQKWKWRSLLLRVQEHIARLFEYWL
ncbi:MAG: cardiolipin synthase [Sulfuriferula multivorans]|uniref:Cardiolipin synthase n=1 Tax=Sulfuriferula multivorans TaxID=1559896 RepID=A0A7C9JVW3_9PROT|nr:cardiolipin synthase [Sulfuriferula multivorans]